MEEKNNKKHISKVIKLWKEKNNIQLPDNNHSVINIIDQIAGFFAVGSYYYYIFNFETMQMEYVHDSVKEIIGVEPSEFTLEKILSLYHPGDIAKIHEKENAALEFLFNKINIEDIPHYKVVYLNRLKTKEGNYKKILHQAKTINVSLEGKIQRVLGVHTDITYLNADIDHKISFISSTLPSYYSLDPQKLEFDKIQNKSDFTESELKIIELIAKGETASEIAEILYIAEETVKSHKKNILRKSGAKNAVELIANCIREGIIL